MKKLAVIFFTLFILLTSVALADSFTSGYMIVNPDRNLFSDKAFTYCIGHLKEQSLVYAVHNAGVNGYELKFAVAGETGGTAYQNAYICVAEPRVLSAAESAAYMETLRANGAPRSVDDIPLTIVEIDPERVVINDGFGTIAMSGKGKVNINGGTNLRSEPNTNANFKILLNKGVELAISGYVMKGEVKWYKAKEAQEGNIGFIQAQYVDLIEEEAVEEKPLLMKNAASKSISEWTKEEIKAALNVSYPANYVEGTPFTVSWTPIENEEIEEIYVGINYYDSNEGSYFGIKEMCLKPNISSYTFNKGIQKLGDKPIYLSIGGGKNGGYYTTEMPINFVNSETQNLISANAESETVKKGEYCYFVINSSSDQVTIILDGTPYETIHLDNTVTFYECELYHIGNHTFVFRDAEGNESTPISITVTDENRHALDPVIIATPSIINNGENIYVSCSSVEHAYVYSIGLLNAEWELLWESGWNKMTQATIPTEFLTPGERYFISVDAAGYGYEDYEQSSSTLEFVYNNGAIDVNSENDRERKNLYTELGVSYTQSYVEGEPFTISWNPIDELSGIMIGLYYYDRDNEILKRIKEVTIEDTNITSYTFSDGVRRSDGHGFDIVPCIKLRFEGSLLYNYGLEYSRVHFLNTDSESTDASSQKLDAMDIIEELNVSYPTNYVEGTPFTVSWTPIEDERIQEIYLGICSSDGNVSGEVSGPNAVDPHLKSYTFTNGIQNYANQNFYLLVRVHYVDDQGNLQWAYSKNLPITINSPDSNHAISVNVTSDHLYENQLVDFSIVTNSTQVSMFIDGEKVDESSYNLYQKTNSIIAVSYSFSNAGEYSVVFKDNEGNESIPLSITVEGQMKMLDSLSIVAPKTVNLGEDVSVSWTTVENASSYYLELMYEGVEIWRCETINTEASIPSEYLSANKKYTVCVGAQGLAYEGYYVTNSSVEIHVLGVNTEPLITATASLSKVSVGSEISFTISSSSSQATMFVNGVEYATVTLTGESTIYTRAFYTSGEKSIVFKDANGNESNTITINVTAEGMLEPAEITVASSVEIGSDIPVSWKLVEHASNYHAILLNSDGIKVWETSTTDLTITIPANVVSTDNNYSVLIITTGYNYSQSESSANFAVVQEIVNPYVTATTAITTASVGDEVQFTIGSTSSQVSCVVNGTAVDTINLAGTTTHTRVFSEVGEKTIVFQDANGISSDPILITVTDTLAPTVITASDTIEEGNNIPVSWTAVSHAAGYKVSLISNENTLWEQETAQLNVLIPADTVSAGNQYSIHVTSVGEEFYLQSVATASLSVTAVAPFIVASTASSTVKVNEDVAFSIESNMTSVQLYVDSMECDAIFVNGTASFTYKFSQPGDKKIQFKNGNTASDVISLKVVEPEKLAATVITVPAEVEAGDSISVSWTSVEHATSYTIQLINGENIVWSDETDKTKVTILGSSFTEDTNYTIKVVASAIGYTSSEAVSTVYVKPESVLVPPQTDFITATASSNRITGGEKVTFTIKSSFDKVYYFVDGSRRKTIVLKNGEGKYTYEFSYPGEHVITFKWSNIETEPIRITVDKIGDLLPTKVHVRSEVYEGEDVDVYWEIVENADEYEIQVAEKRTGNVKWKRTIRKTNSTIPFEALSARKQYVVTIIARADGYMQSESTAEFLVFESEDNDTNSRPGTDPGHSQDVTLTDPSDIPTGTLAEDRDINFYGLGNVIEVGKSLTVYWNEVFFADHYEFAARYTDESEQLVKRQSTGKSTKIKIGKSAIVNNKVLRLWVGAFDENGTQLAGKTIEIPTTSSTAVTLDDPPTSTNVEIPDFSTNLVSYGFGKDTKVTWTVPEMPGNPYWKPSEYIIWWYGPGVGEGGYSMKVNNRIFEATLPAEKTLVGGNYSVDVYAVIENESGQVVKQRSSSKEFAVSPFIGTPTVTANNSTAMVGDQFTITAITDQSITSLSTVNNSPTSVLYEDFTYVEKNDGTKTWTKVYTANTATDNRYWKITAKIDGKEAGYAETNSVSIGSTIIGTPSFAPTGSSAYVGDNFTVKFITNGTITSVLAENIANEQLRDFDKTVNSNGTITWTATYDQKYAVNNRFWTVYAYVNGEEKERKNTGKRTIVEKPQDNVQQTSPIYISGQNNNNVLPEVQGPRKIKIGEEKKAIPIESYKSEIDEFSQKYTMFDAGIDTVLDNTNNPLHVWAAAFYRGADIIGTSIDLISKGNEEKRQTKYEKEIISNNLQNYILREESESYVDIVTNVKENLETISGKEEEEQGIFYEIEVPTGEGNTITIVESIYTTLTENVPFDIPDNDTMALIVDGSIIACETIEDLISVFNMQYSYDRTMEYIENIMKYADVNSSLYKACKEIKDSVDSCWPVGGVVKETAKKGIGLTLSYHAGKFINLAYKTKGSIIATHAAGIESILQKYGLMKESFYLNHIKEFSKIGQSIGEMSGVLMAWEAGAKLGEMVTADVNHAIDDEEEILRLCIMKNEIQSAMRRGSVETGAYYDLTSLKLLIEEEGIETSYKYFNRTNNIRFWSKEDMTEIEKTTDRQIESINSIRKKMKLPVRNINVDEPYKSPLGYIDPEAGDHF